MKRYLRIATFVWLAVSGAVGFVGCRNKLQQLFTPQPISATNRPSYFYVVAYDKAKSPILLLHERSIAVTEERQDHQTNKEFRKTQAKEGRLILWDEDNRPGGPYTFYIDKGILPSIPSTAKADIDRNLQYFTVKLLKDDPKTHSQTIRVDFINDDFSYYSIYEVSGGHAVPIKYGDAVKADGAEALLYGFRLFALVFAVGYVLIKTTGWAERRRATRS